MGSRLEEDKKQETSATNSAMKMFQNRDRVGQSEMETKINTTHQNQVISFELNWNGDIQILIRDINLLADL